jgi:hypothetical protein
MIIFISGRFCCAIPLGADDDKEDRNKINIT